jgi:hypothetical protein
VSNLGTARQTFLAVVAILDGRPPRHVPYLGGNLVEKALDRQLTSAERVAKSIQGRYLREPDEVDRLLRDVGSLVSGRGLQRPGYGGTNLTADRRLREISEAESVFKVLEAADPSTASALDSATQALAELRQVVAALRSDAPSAAVDSKQLERIAWLCYSGAHGELLGEPVAQRPADLPTPVQDAPATVMGTMAHVLEGVVAALERGISLTEPMDGPTTPASRLLTVASTVWWALDAATGQLVGRAEKVRRAGPSRSASAALGEALAKARKVLGDPVGPAPRNETAPVADALSTLEGVAFAVQGGARVSDYAENLKATAALCRQAIMAAGVTRKSAAVLPPELSTVADALLRLRAVAVGIQGGASVADYASEIEAIATLCDTAAGGALDGPAPAAPPPPPAESMAALGKALSQAAAVQKARSPVRPPARVPAPARHQAFPAALPPGESRRVAQGLLASGRQHGMGWVDIFKTYNVHVQKHGLTPARAAVRAALVELRPAPSVYDLGAGILGVIEHD